MPLELYVFNSQTAPIWDHSQMMSGDFLGLLFHLTDIICEWPFHDNHVDTLESFPPGVILVVLRPVQYELAVAVEVAVVVVVKLGADQVRLACWGTRIVIF